MILPVPTAWLKSISIASGIESPTFRMKVGSTVPGAAVTRSFERWNGSGWSVLFQVACTVDCLASEIGPTQFWLGMPPTEGSDVPQLWNWVPPKYGSPENVVPVSNCSSFELATLRTYIVALSEGFVLSLKISKLYMYAWSLLWGPSLVCVKPTYWNANNRRSSRDSTAATTSWPRIRFRRANRAALPCVREASLLRANRLKMLPNFMALFPKKEIC